ncbi:hypothetical protein QUB68_01785 [Microcoleus sp. A006_D1]|uniref:hypothetical protein n=1 Tax=Microcoleus sp. A006_D1 TaxID=3055267 RepID=UPI002FCEC827
MKLFDPQHYPPLIPGFNKQYPVAIIPEKLHAVFSGWLSKNLLVERALLSLSKPSRN